MDEIMWLGPCLVVLSPLLSRRAPNFPHTALPLSMGIRSLLLLLLKLYWGNLLSLAVLLPTGSWEGGDVCVAVKLYPKKAAIFSFFESWVEVVWLLCAVGRFVNVLSGPWGAALCPPALSQPSPFPEWQGGWVWLGGGAAWAWCGPVFPLLPSKLWTLV